MSSIVWLLIIGAAAGYIATRLLRIDANIFVTIIIGMLGALVGGLVLSAILTVIGLAASLIGAVIGALILIALWKAYLGRKIR
ncbi:MAG: GlsB/YeaQ/YmgE family stress response membrane protein [Rhodobacterales bacterium]